MKTLSSTEADWKKALLIKKCVLHPDLKNVNPQFFLLSSETRINCVIWQLVKTHYPVFLDISTSEKPS